MLDPLCLVTPLSGLCSPRKVSGVWNWKAAAARLLIKRIGHDWPHSRCDTSRWVRSSKATSHDPRSAPAGSEQKIRKTRFELLIRSTCRLFAVISIERSTVQEIYWWHHFHSSPPLDPRCVSSAFFLTYRHYYTTYTTLFSAFLVRKTTESVKWNG